MSLPAFYRFVENYVDSYKNETMRHLLIKTKNREEKTVSKVFNTLNDFLKNDLKNDRIEIWDYRDYEETIN